MEFEELNSIIENIDKSLDKQITLITEQLAELKCQILHIEKLLNTVRNKNSN